MAAPAGPVRPLITWLNHASFLLKQGGTGLLCDPWFGGTAFNDGWQLISDTAFAYGRFSDVTHLWLSHQHPDHFAPGTLRRITAQDRARITVFYRRTDDKLVVNWCKSAGFRHVVELPTGKWVRVSNDLEVLCDTVADDSWLAMRCADEFTLLNLNDCVIRRPETVERIASMVGRVDVLFTQFSYAQWEGNPEESELRRLAAREKFDRIRLQDAHLAPKTIVPFASFVYFCHEENFHLNDGMNMAGDVASFIENDLKTRAVVLYPGESWIAGEPRDWRPSAQRYAGDVAARLRDGPTHFVRKVERDRLLSCANGFLKRLSAKNPRAQLLIRERAVVFVTDFDEAFEISINGMRSTSASREEADVITSAENLVYAFRMPWGGNTLHVSGRFTSPHHTHKTFFRLVRELHRYNVLPVDGAWALAEARRILRGIKNRAARLIERR